VQTFMPYQDFAASARVLDNKRLGKQRVEALQIIKALHRESGGWVNHPAVRMWRGYEPLLWRYLQAVVTEWVERGYKNTIAVFHPAEEVLVPPWWGDERLHRSHRSNLLRKDPVHYAMFTDVPNDLPYFWPV